MSCSVCRLPIAEAAPRPGPRSREHRCPFCLAGFSRVDGATRHAKRCPQRGSRAVHPGKRGRKALSCDRCSRVKIQCNAWAQTPCHGCASRKLACTFSRCCTDITHQQPVSKVPPNSPHWSKDHVPLSFLLSSTDDKQDFITERAVGEEPDGALLGPICIMSTQTSGEPPDCIDPMLLLPSTCPPGFLPLELYTAEEESLLDTFFTFRSQEDRLAGRIQLLESDVATYARSHDRYRASFDPIGFRHFFTVSNVYTFAKTFCRKRHYRYPIIHWPTFALEEASLPLLMVVALTGASYSYRTAHEPEHIRSARNLYPLADSYVFDQLDACFAPLPLAIDNTEVLQLCQAALLMYGLDTLLARDLKMQHTAIALRLPTLISAIRRLDFIDCRHNSSEDWQLFLYREQIIRLVNWTFCADCLATLSCNNPPLFSMLEMTGDLPCDPVLWETDSGLDFELLRSSSQRPSHSLKDLISSFINSDRQPDIEEKNLPLFHLHVILCGFQQVIFNLQLSLALPEQSDKLLLRLDKWRHLWGRAMDQIPSSHRNWLGVAKYVPGIEYLSRRVIEVAVSPEAGSSRYLQRIPSYSLKEIHEFIRDFVAKP